MHSFQNHSIHNDHDLLLVILSYFIAATSAYVSIELARRVTSSSRASKYIWVIAGGSMLGLGIWSMHFVAMLAHDTYKEATYSLPLVLLSVVIAMLGCMIGFAIVSWKMSLSAFLIGGLLMGTAIGGMHYVGIAALRGVSLTYHLEIVALSVLIAIAASWTALYVGFFSKFAKDKMLIQTKVFFAFVMGIAIFGMHYVGMMGLNGQLIDDSKSSRAISPDALVLLVSTVTIFLFIVFFTSLVIDLKLKRRDLIQATILESTKDGVVTTDHDGNIFYANSVFYRLFPESNINLFSNHPELSLNHSKKKNLQVRDKVIEIVHHPLKGENLDQVLWFFRDITESMVSQRLIEHMAFHDRLTNLPNREKIERLLDERMENSVTVSCLSINIERWRFLSDMLGQHAIDILTLQIATRLKQTIHPNDVLARLDSSDFIVLLSDERSSLAKQKAEKCFAALSKPFDIEGTVITISMSAGISHFPQDADNSKDLILYSKLASYTTHDNESLQIKEFLEDTRHEILRSVEIEKVLLSAIQNQEFSLVFQPKISLHSNTMTGVEVLSRWFNPSLGIVSPSEFIKVAEKTGHIHSFGTWVLRESCLRWVAWQQRGIPAFSIAVNVSPLQFASKDFLSTLQSILEDTKMDPSYLELEITESSALSYEEALYEKITFLNNLGIRISLDDFGTGYSSFQQLRTLPIHLLKIDRSFITSLFDSSNQQAIVQSMIHLGHNLDMKVLVEGVEFVEQVEWLSRQGCDYIQGYYYSQPLNEEDLLKYAASNVIVSSNYLKMKDS